MDYFIEKYIYFCVVIKRIEYTVILIAERELNLIRATTDLPTSHYVFTGNSRFT
jgi:hypothetical protein